MSEAPTGGNAARRDPRVKRRITRKPGPGHGRTIVIYQTSEERWEMIRQAAARCTVKLTPGQIEHIRQLQLARARRAQRVAVAKMIGWGIVLAFALVAFALIVRAIP